MHLSSRCVVDEVPRKPDENLEQGSNHSSSSENANRECVAEDSYSNKVSISVADPGETAIVVSMVGGNKSAEEPRENIRPTVEVDEDLKTHTFMLTSEDNSQKLTVSSRETSTTQPFLKAQELELSLSCDTSLSVDKSINEHISFGDINSLSGELAEESHISKNLSSNNSDMGLHLGLSIGSFLSGNFAHCFFLLCFFFLSSLIGPLIKITRYVFYMFMQSSSVILIINVHLVDEMDNNGTDDQMNEDVKQKSPSEEEEHIFKGRIILESSSLSLFFFCSFLGTFIGHVGTIIFFFVFG